MACLLKPSTHHCASARWYVLLRAFQAPFRLLIATPRRPHLVDAQSKPPAKKMTSVEYLDTMYGGIGPENGKILGTSYPPAAIAMAKLGTPATLDFMR